MLEGNRFEQRENHWWSSQWSLWQSSGPKATAGDSGRLVKRELLVKGIVLQGSGEGAHQ